MPLQEDLIAPRSELFHDESDERLFFPSFDPDTVLKSQCFYTESELDVQKLIEDARLDKIMTWEERMEKAELNRAIRLSVLASVNQERLLQYSAEGNRPGGGRLYHPSEF